MLGSDPKRAADELHASYKLDERTDTLALYAQALAKDGRYAHALETWKRVILFRESELDAAKSGRGDRKKATAKAQARIEEAAQQIIKLWPNVGRVKVRIPAGQQVTVWHDGMEVDASKDVLVNANKDELVFASKDGGEQRVTVQVPAGGVAKIDAPSIDAPKPMVAKKAPAANAPKPAAKPMKIEQPKPAPVEPIAKEDAEEPQPEALKPANLSAVKLGVEAPRSRTMSRVGVGLVGGAIVAGGIAGGLAFLADRDYDKAKTLGCNADDQCPIGPAADLAERSNDRARLAQISAVGAGAMLATGITLWIVGRNKTRRMPADVTLRVGPSSTAIGWRF